MQTYISVRSIWKISRKPFLQCFTCRHTFSGSRVIGEKPPSKTIDWLLRSLKRFKTFQAMNIEPMFLFFQLCAYLRMKFGNVVAVGRIPIGKKKHLTKRQLHLQHWWVWFSQGTNFCSIYSISQGIDRFISYQAIKIVPMFITFQIVACLRRKFGNVEAVDRLQIRKKKYLANRYLHREHW